MFSFFKTKQKKNGFTILELLIAIFVIVVAVVAAISLISQTISFMSLSSSKLIASYLAQEGIEVVRNIRDGNWLQTGQLWNNGLKLDPPCSDLKFCHVSYGFGSESPPNNENPDIASFVKQVLYIDNKGFYGYDPTPPSQPTKFTREIYIEDKGDYLSVKIIVWWNQIGSRHDVEVQEHLYNWYNP